MSDTSLDLAARLGDLLLQRGWRVTTAESCTGGGVADAITSIAGSSRWFEYGYVTYSNGAKTRLLGISEDSLAREGAVSEAVVREMASGALAAANADLAVSISGVAGPEGGSGEKPVGTVWFAWASRERLIARVRHFEGDRLAVRRQAVEEALAGLVEMCTV